MCLWFVYLFQVVIEILTSLYVYFKLPRMCPLQHFGLAKVLFCVKAKRDLFRLHCSSSLICVNKYLTVVFICMQMSLCVNSIKAECSLEMLVIMLA